MSATGVAGSEHAGRAREAEASTGQQGRVVRETADADTVGASEAALSYGTLTVAPELVLQYLVD